MKRNLLIYFCTFFLSGAAQNVTISGLALHQRHAEIAIYTYDDLITYYRTQQDKDTIDMFGKFSLSVSINKPQLVIIKVGNQFGRIYLQPDFVYGIKIPARDSTLFLPPGKEEEMDISIVGDSTELNARIIEFNNRLDEFWEDFYFRSVKKFSHLQLDSLHRVKKKNGTVQTLSWSDNLSGSLLKFVHRDLDSFQFEMMSRYRMVRLQYFQTYIDYSFAILNSNTGRHPNFLAKHYLVERPIAYHNYEYMEFFNLFFTQYLQKHSTGKSGNLMYDAIQTQGDFKHLNELMKGDPALKSDSLRELVAIKGLFELYFTPHYKKESIKSMLVQAEHLTNNQEHRLIISNMLRNINNLQSGASAPDLFLTDQKGESYRLLEPPLRYIYLGFFSPWSTTCMEQLKKEEQLFRIFGKQVNFVSVCIARDSLQFKEFMRKHPFVRWQVLFAREGSEKIRDYNILSVPSYYLINPQGKIIQSPALAPDEGIEEKFYKIFNIKKRGSGK